MIDSFIPRISMLDVATIESIVAQACEILAQIGVQVENKQGQQLLLQGGAGKNADRFTLPEQLVLSSLASAPKQILMYDRDGGLAMDVSGENIHFNPGSAAIHILDAASRERRNAVTQDVVNLVTLVDALPHYAAQSTALSPRDIPEDIADRYRLFIALMFGKKPIITGTFRKDGFASMRDMLAVVRGGEEELAAKPLAIFDCCPSPPLKWSDLTCQCVIDCAKARIPAELISMPLTGATSPVTLRETVVQHTAETLSGVVIHQLACSGAPVIYGGAPAAFDMRHGTTPMGSIETMMIHLAYSQVGKYFCLPTHGYLALSDAKCPDYQAGMETGIGAVLAGLAGINVISGPGILDYILSQSLEKLLLDHEACGMALRLVRGISNRNVDLLTLMTDLVKGGELLSHPHTRAHWREELTVASKIIDRNTYNDWKAQGGDSAEIRAAKEVKHRLAKSPLPSLERHQVMELEKIMGAEAGRYGLDELPLRNGNRK